MSDRKTDHDRVMASGAFWGMFAASLFMAWLAVTVPYIVAWLINSAIMVSVSYAMARYKRTWYARVSFWLIVAVCATNGTLKAFTPLLNNPWSSANWVIAWVVVGSWYWLIRLPRHRAAEPAVSHVVHHHVLHHPDGRVVEIGQQGTGSYGTELPASQRAVPGSTAPKAIESGIVRLAGAVERLREVRRRGA